jgi:hypothetical protein
MEQGRGRELMQTNEHDVNVYVDNDIVKIVCYRMMVDSEGELVATDTQSEPKIFAISINETDPELKEILRFALDAEYYDSVEEKEDWVALHGSWQSYWAGTDTWESSTTFSKNATPILASFLDSLPFYEPKTLAYNN